MGAGVETAISPVFGLTLLEWADWIALGGALVSAGLVGTLLFIHRRQHSLQRKMVSAQLSQKMLEYWEPDKHRWFVTFVELMPVSDGGIKEGDPGIARYLSIWEEIAMYCNEGTITKNHRDQLFVPDLKYIRSNKVVCGYLKKKHTNMTYNNLWKLMEETCGTCTD